VRVGRLAPGQHRHDRIVGGHHVRSSDAFRHQPVQRLDQVRHVAAPNRLRGARDLEALPREDIFQPVQRQVIGELARYDVAEQTRPGQSLLDHGVRLCRGLDLCAGTLAFAVRAGVLLTQMLDALEPGGNVFDLPAFPAPISLRSVPQFGQARSSAFIS